MQHRMMDRWIETAEARKFCQWAIAEQPRRADPEPMPQPASLMGKLRAMVMLDLAHLHAFAPAKPHR